MMEWYVEWRRMSTELQKPGLSWSRSRSTLFHACNRQYFYKYHLSWNGWDYSAEERRRLAYRLSKMTSFPLLAGIAAHESIRQLLCSIRDGVPLKQHPVDLAKDMIRRVKDGAVSKGWLRRPKAHPPLEEYYYLGEPSLLVREKYWKVARTAISAFMESSLFRWIKSTDPSTWLAVDEPLNFDDPEVFEIDGCRVWSRPDFALKWRDFCVIFDWKTGGPKPDDQIQLQSYALHARACWGFEPRKIRTVAVYLGEHGSSRHAFKVTEESLAAVESRIRHDLHVMRLAEAGGDVESQWSLAHDAHSCTNCFFREVCPAVMAIPAHLRMENNHGTVN